MKKIFDGLRPFQKAELLIMMLLAFAIPFSWLAAQYCEVALLLCAVLKFIFDQKCQLNENQKRFKWAYIIFAMTWVIYLVGMIYTDNQSFGWMQVSKKLGFLIFPMIFLFSDMSYITKQRLKAIGNTLILGCILFFFMNLVYAVYDVIFNGETTARFFDQELMKWYYVHHSYLSMYASLGLMFCFMGIFENTERKVKIINILAYIILVVFIILVSFHHLGEVARRSDLDGHDLRFAMDLAHFHYEKEENGLDFGWNLHPGIGWRYRGVPAERDKNNENHHQHHFRTFFRPPTRAIQRL